MTTSVALTTDTPRATRSGAFWAWFPVAIIVSNVTGLVWMATIAIRDPGFALESDYYDKAVHWDQSQAALAESARLGWHLNLTANPQGQGVELRVKLVDAAGKPVSGAEVRAEAFPNARSAQRHELRFIERDLGVYLGTLSSSRSELWEFRFVAKAGRRRFLETVRMDPSRPEGKL